MIEDKKVGRQHTAPSWYGMFSQQIAKYLVYHEYYLATIFLFFIMVVYA